MGNLNIKRLAKMSAYENKVDPDIARFVLHKLGRRELLSYLRHLKAIVNRKTVRVYSKDSILESQRKNIIRSFPNKEILFVQEEIGDGIKIQINDTVIDFSVHSYINTVIDRLKEKI